MIKAEEFFMQLAGFGALNVLVGVVGALTLHFVRWVFR